jgi:hypothetical protein
MNSSPPPTSHNDNAEAAAVAMAEDMRRAIGAWFERTRKRGFRIPFVSELLSRVTRTGG